MSLKPGIGITNVQFFSKDVSQERDRREEKKKEMNGQTIKRKRVMEKQPKEKKENHRKILKNKKHCSKSRTSDILIWAMVT